VSVTPIPSLDELAADPAKAVTLPPAVAAELLVRVIGLQTALATRALAVPTNGRAAEAAEDRLLDVAEAARLLGVSVDWVYRRAAKLPFAIRLGPGILRFSAAGLARYIQQRQGRA